MSRKFPIILVLLLALVSADNAFAAEVTPVAISSDKGALSVVSTYKATPTAISTPTIIPNMTFSADVKTLTIAESQKKMTADSPSKKVIDIHKEQMLNKSQGHLESVQSYSSYLNAGQGQAGMPALLDVERYLRDFAKAQTKPNYDAEMNKLELDTVDQYYSLKQAESLESIASANYGLKRILLSNTQKKFEVGTVSKVDVLQAESAINTAKDDLFKAQNELKSAKMAFNRFVGFDLMQTVNLTDSLKQVPLPTKSLETSIREALLNRNEIRAGRHGVDYATLGLAVYKDYPKDSENYLNAKLAVAEAEKGKADATLGIELDVRSKYIAMKQKYEAITSGEKNVANAKESVRLAQLQYDVGMTTLTSVNDAQILLNKAELGLSQNLFDYNMAVAEYNYASGIGTSTVPVN